MDIAILKPRLLGTKFCLVRESGNRKHYYYLGTRLSIMTRWQVGKVVKSARRAYLRFKLQQDCDKSVAVGALIRFPRGWWEQQPNFQTFSRNVSYRSSVQNSINSKTNLDLCRVILKRCRWNFSQNKLLVQIYQTICQGYGARDGRRKNFLKQVHN